VVPVQLDIIRRDPRDFQEVARQVVEEEAIARKVVEVKSKLRSTSSGSGGT
jgi:hypothetical protein